MVRRVDARLSDVRPGKVCHARDANLDVGGFSRAPLRSWDRRLGWRPLAPRRPSRFGAHWRVIRAQGALTEIDIGRAAGKGGSHIGFEAPLSFVFTSAK